MELEKILKEVERIDRETEYWFDGSLLSYKDFSQRNPPDYNTKVEFLAKDAQWLLSTVHDLVGKCSGAKKILEMTTLKNHREISGHTYKPKTWVCYWCEALFLLAELKGEDDGTEADGR